MAPIISEITTVASPTTDTTPDYTFTTDEAGTITYGGDCTSVMTAAIVGSNTITFNVLTTGAHSNCTVSIEDAVGNDSNILFIDGFTITSTTSTTSAGG